MHEYSLMKDLMRKVLELCQRANGDRVESITVRLGALAHITPDHFREHFEEASRGTPAQGAHLIVEQSTDETDARAQDIMLVSIDVTGGDTELETADDYNVMFTDAPSKDH